VSRVDVARKDCSSDPVDERERVGVREQPGRARRTLRVRIRVRPGHGSYLAGAGLAEERWMVSGRR